jgi:hypothetical protein
VWQQSAPSVAEQLLSLSASPESLSQILIVAFQIFAGEDSTLCYNEMTAIDPLEQSAIESGESVLLWPNPAGATLTISPAAKTIKKVVICDAFGRTVKEIPLHTSQNEITVSVDDLNKGVYLVQVISEKEVVVKKLVKN